MARNIPCGTTSILSIEEYVDHVARKVDVRDLDSVAESAPLLKALANDRSLIVRELNQRLEASLKDGGIASAQTLVLGKGAGFYVRANIWPAISDMATGRAYQNQFAYNLAHDHNFSFLTVNYLGPGYDTELYEYDYDKVEGYVGEAVDLRFVEKVRFGSGSVMLYRESKDVHIQFPPTELTVTINLMIAPPDFRDQYHFDMTTRTISSALDLPAMARTSFVRIAAAAGNQDTLQLLSDLSASHPCRRTRLAALEGLSQRDPAMAERIWGKATADPAVLVAKTARRKLDEIGK